MFSEVIGSNSTLAKIHTASIMFSHLLDFPYFGVLAFGSTDFQIPYLLKCKRRSAPLTLHSTRGKKKPFV